MAEPITLITLQYQDGRQESITSENYVAFADRFMSNRENNFKELTTSKLRAIYGQIANLYTRINSQTDYEQFSADIQYLRVKMAYEAGRDDRDKAVKPFLRHTYLMKMVPKIKDYDSFIAYCRYAESLVAYFKFYGGKDYS